MVYPEVYHIALTKQEYHLLQQLVQTGNCLTQPDDITTNSIPEPLYSGE